MAQEKIFISYSRKDKEKVFAIRDEIENVTLQKCWIDLNGIESDDQFEEVIISAINNADIFIFMYSENSAQSKWTKDELRFATKKKKRVVFVTIDQEPLSDWFLFKYDGHDIIDYSNDEQKQKMFRNLREWCTTSSDSTSNKSGQNRYASITFNTDANCEIYSDGVKMGNGSVGKDIIINMLPGRHTFKFVSTLHPIIKDEITYTIPDTNYTNTIYIRLDERIQKYCKTRNWSKNTNDTHQPVIDRKEDDTPRWVHIGQFFTCSTALILFVYSIYGLIMHYFSDTPPLIYPWETLMCMLISCIGCIVTFDNFKNGSIVTLISFSVSAFLLLNCDISLYRTNDWKVNILLIGILIICCSLLYVLVKTLKSNK